MSESGNAHLDVTSREAQHCPKGLKLKVIWKIYFRHQTDNAISRVFVAVPSKSTPIGIRLTFSGTTPRNAPLHRHPPFASDRLERALIESGLSYAILRPTVLFGKEDILINNIAWILRKFPLFGVFGDGEYRLQPLYVDDLAKLAVREGAERENRIIDAIGPETFTYRELVRQIGIAIGKPRPVVSVPPSIGFLVAFVLGTLVGDVVITREEIAGLMSNLLYTNSSPTGDTRLTDWLQDHSEILGVRYASEIARRRERVTAYEKL